jgi:hypothetical protein
MYIMATICTHLTKTIWLLDSRCQANIHVLVQCKLLFWNKPNDLKIFAWHLDSSNQIVLVGKCTYNIKKNKMKPKTSLSFLGTYICKLHIFLIFLWHNISSTASFLSKLRAKKVEKLHNSSFYRKFRKWNIGFRNRERGSLAKIRVGRVTVNTHIFFLALWPNIRFLSSIFAEKYVNEISDSGTGNDYFRFFT